MLLRRFVVRDYYKNSIVPLRSKRPIIYHSFRTFDAGLSTYIGMSSIITMAMIFPGFELKHLCFAVGSMNVWGSAMFVGFLTYEENFLKEQQK